MAELLQVEGLTKTFGERCAVDHVTFTVKAAEVFGLLGPNGAGKSTTMMMVANVLTPDSGEVKLNGQARSANSLDVRSRLGVVPQELAIYPELTADENLRFFGRLYHLSGARLNTRVDAVLERVGLTARRDDPAENFSGGMKRRLNFAIALLHEPDVLILDEPTVGVDPQSRAHLMQCVRDVAAEGTAVIYATHYMEEVEAVCHRIAIMDHGKVLTCGPLDTLLAQTAGEFEIQLGRFDPEKRSALPDEVELHTDGFGTTILKMRADRTTNGDGLPREIGDVVNLLFEQSIPIVAIRTHEPSLERLFLQLTGNSLRD